MKVLGTGTQTNLTAATALKPAATTTLPGQTAGAATLAASVHISPEAHQAYEKSQQHPVSGTWHAPGKRYFPASPAAPTSKTLMPTDPTGTGTTTPKIPTLMPTDPTKNDSLKTPTDPTLMPTDPTGGGPGLDLVSSQLSTLGATNMEATTASITQDYPKLMPSDPAGTGSFGAPPASK